MDFSLSSRARALVAEVRAFVQERIVPAEERLTRDRVGPSDNASVGADAAGHLAEALVVIDKLQQDARAQGLWNLFLPEGSGDDYARRFGTSGGSGLSHLDYAPVAEEMGRSLLAPLVFNCNAPDTGNMEVLLKYGTQQQKARWLEPLLDGRVRSAFLMTEPGVASADATNMAATAVADGDDIVLNGRKWWSTGVGHPDCRVAIFMGRTFPEGPRHASHSMVLVPLESPGVRIERLLPALGHYDEPLGHGEVSLTDVRVPRDHVIGELGAAFAIAQGRLGPGRVHHCMRLIGLAEMALDLACRRGTQRQAFGRPLVDLGGNAHRLAQARMSIVQARLLVMHAAWKLDTQGSRASVDAVSQIKAVVPQMACDVIDLAIQLHGGGGVSDDFPLAAAYSAARSLRLADGPDEVHLDVVARNLLRPYRASLP